MENIHEVYKEVVINLQSGYAYHKIILDELGNPYDYEFLDVNATFERMTGLSLEGVVGKTIRQISSEDPKEIQKWVCFFGDIAKNNKKKHTKYYSNELKKKLEVQSFSNKEGFFISLFDEMNDQITGETGEPDSKETVNSTINELIFHKDIAEHLAYHDHLTGLPNRRMFQQKLTEAMDISKRAGTNVGVVFIDLDNFKYVNDNMGHSVGDKLLKNITKRLASRIRKSETLARLGGDEFGIILQNIRSENQIHDFCERIRLDMNEPVEFDGYIFHISASMGVAIYPRDGDKEEELLRNADTAMYGAKNLGKNNVKFFQNSMRNENTKRRHMELRLRKALIDGDFELNYQPQVDFNLRKIISFEALLRWNDEELGQVSPDQFVNVAEEIGLLIPIGEWVLKEACRKAVQWQRISNQEFVVSVNIAEAQLKRQNFVEVTKNIIDITGIRPQFLEMEMSESIFLNCDDAIEDVLWELKDLGVKLSVDNFGQKCSSINLIRKMPFDSIKMDITFMNQIMEEKEVAAATIALLHKLKLPVTVTGVENQHQLNQLTKIGCDAAQGYFLGRPLHKRDVMEFIQKHNKVSVSEYEEVTV